MSLSGSGYNTYMDGDNQVPDSLNIDLTPGETMAVSIALSALQDAHMAKHGRHNPIVTALMEKLGKAIDDQIISKMSEEDIAAGQAKVDEIMGTIQKKDETQRFMDDLRKGFSVD